MSIASNELLNRCPCTMQAIREGADAVIAVGGDGTLHEVKTALLKKKKLLLGVLMLFDGFIAT